MEGCVIVSQMEDFMHYGQSVIGETSYIIKSAYIIRQGLEEGKFLRVISSSILLLRFVVFFL